MGSLLVAESDSEEYYFSKEGPGHRLQSAREALHLDVGSVARSLHLTRDMVHALEENEYDILPAPVFVRGYLRNYARLLGEPVEPILRAYSESCPEGAEGALRTSNMDPEIGSSHFLVRLVTWGIIIGVIALLVIWWQGYLEGGKPLTETPEPTLEGATETLTEPAAPIGPLPNPIQRETPGEEPAPAADAAAPAPATETSAATTETPATEAEQPATEGAAEQAAEADAPPESAPKSGVALAFAGNSWVNIKDASGKSLLLGEIKGGERRELDGRPPYKIVLGRADAVNLTVNGEPYDLTPHSRANVARFTLDPGAPD